MWTFVGSISSILKLLLAFVLFGARVSMRLRSDIYYIGTLDTLHFFYHCIPSKEAKKSPNYRTVVHILILLHFF